MADIELSAHARDMLAERKILEEWMWRTIKSPDRRETRPDNTVHYTQAIEENEGRILRVIVNTEVEPNRVITLFFDRRLRRAK